MNKILSWLKLQREGIVVGSIIALLLWWRNWNLPFNLPDTLSSGIPKLIIFIIIFSGVGAIIDSIYEPSK